MNPCSQHPQAKPWRGAAGSHGISVFESVRDFPVSLVYAPSPQPPAMCNGASSSHGLANTRSLLVLTRTLLWLWSLVTVLCVPLMSRDLE